MLIRGYQTIAREGREARLPLLEDFLIASNYADVYKRQGMDKRMKKHGGNVMAGLLADYGVTAVFGVPGGQTLPLYYGILDEGNRIRHILMKDEIDATFAADAYARISGGIGVCDATAAGSYTHLPEIN